MGVKERESSGYVGSVMFLTVTGLIAVIVARLLADRSERIEAGYCTLAFWIPCWVAFGIRRYFQSDRSQTIWVSGWIVIMLYWGSHRLC